ncbi:endoglucanase E precursor [Massarina eburnea CBS 473.64]|uniref:Endoglucanase E n=1 Tax=Massarina eburnea CBS 473.64 TaxID=1395130 RepID=A0A6A6SGF6_9PLEO|nr:endoglucanase E precursor [Massarina eburnea CBS 473.64]
MRTILPFTILAAILSGANAIHLLGRVNPSNQELTWPGTGISFSFTGTTATIHLNTITGTNSAELTTDGIATIIPNINTTSITTPANLTHGTHTITLRKRSEALYGSLTIGNITTDGTLIPDAPPSRKIEVIGDSITVGYGLDGTLPCTNSAALENNPKTYAALSAQALKADYSIIAWSGIGLTRNYVSTTPDPSPVMPVRWTRYGANDADDSYTFPKAAVPDVVVINLGTNDFSYLGVREPLNATVYTDAMVEFVGVVNKHYPDATFFLVTSPMLSDAYPEGQAQKYTQTSALKAAIEVLGGMEVKVHLVEWPTQGSDVGCDYHPNAATHAVEAEVLADAIAEVMSW